MVEDEELFVLLSMMPARDHVDARELILQGYLDRDLYDTEKSCRFQKQFIDARKDLVYRVIREKGSCADLAALMEKAGIRHSITFERVANTLVAGRLLVKKDNSYSLAAGCESV